MNTLIFDFWGKAEKGGVRYHPAVCHMIDTGVVAQAIVSLQPLSFRRRLTGLFNCDEETALSSLAFIASLHDLGKISPGFQAKRDDLCKPLRARGFPFPLSPETKHGRITLVALPDILNDDYACGIDDAYALARILGAHHGIFDEVDTVNAGDMQWAEARREAVSLLARTFDVKSLESLFLDAVPELLLFAGLVSVADWIASDNEVFGYIDGPPADLGAYIASRKETAIVLLSRLSMGAAVESGKPFSALFDFDEPNSCQQATLDVVSNLKHPMLVIVETPMGSGKTEAAQAAYSRLAFRDGLRGMYCALPTQATGNAMFERMKAFLSRLHDDRTVEFHLLHANADMNPKYKELQVNNIDAGDGTVVASSWFTAKKRGLLAGYGTGTIDQALLSILKVRHFFVRLFGLGGKLIVLDEVHAYDAYMSEEISSLIAWASRCDSSVVLLSATLPAAKRARIVQAFSPGVLLPDELKYPCVFGVDLEEGKLWQPVDISPDTLELIPHVVDKADKIALMANTVMGLVERDGCAACIVNTVTEAQELYEKLKEKLPENELILFHSRFTLARRLEIEGEILRKYGNGKDANRPRRGVVVATQVLQESLDVCFDAMVTDLAPIDLLLQRAGRLHRHKRVRPLHLQQRRLYVVLPNLQDGTPDFGWSGLVYFKNLLDRTGKLFFQGNACRSVEISLPCGVAPLIEEVYGEANEAELDKARERWLTEQLGEERAQVYWAKNVSLPSVHECFDDPGILGLLQNGSDDEVSPSTRIGRERITLMILSVGEDITVATTDDARRFYLKSVTTDNVRLVKHFKVTQPPPEWSESPLLRYSYPVFLSDGKAEYGEFELAYDDTRGLSILRTTGGR